MFKVSKAYSFFPLLAHAMHVVFEHLVGYDAHPMSIVGEKRNERANGLRAGVKRMQIVIQERQLKNHGKTCTVVSLPTSWGIQAPLRATW